MPRASPELPPATRKLRVMIADDEPLARDRVRALLERDASVEIAAECANGDEALAAIGRERPDVVFLDMQMPGRDGLQVVAELPVENRPAIVFVTAHDRFAVEAFSAEAVDYVLKPFDAERLQLALERAIRSIRERRIADLGERMERLVAATAERGPERLAFRTEGRVIFLKAGEIVWVEAAKNYSILHLGGTRRLMVRESLAALEERLGAENFARVNRSAIVRIEEVRELQPGTYGDYTVVLSNGLRLPLSRGLRGRFDKFTE